MKKFIPFALITILIFSGIIQSHASDEDLFTVKVPPDALLVLDLSLSMNMAPAGHYMYIDNAKSCGSDTAYYASRGSGLKECYIDYDAVPKYSSPSCSGPFYINNKYSGYTTDCSRLAIAKRALTELLDHSSPYIPPDTNINTVDENSLRIRMGYMRFYNCGSDDTGRNYLSGCNRIIREIKDLGKNNYHDIWSSINGESASGGTPLAAALDEAKLYLNNNKSNDSFRDCRKKFVIFITDGADTFACGGGGLEDQTDQYKRRRETVAKSKALLDAGYKVFVIAFGADLPHHTRNTLNWSAYYGGTKNFSSTQSGDTAAYNPSSIISCQSSPTSSHNLGDGSHYYAALNDPGEVSLSGYAFLVTTASELTAALKAIAKYIEGPISFPSPTVPSVQVVMEETGDTMFVSSFIPKEDNPFWIGNLKAYQLNADGTLPVGSDGKPLPQKNIWYPSADPNTDYGAGETLESANSNNRNILTYVRGSFTSFDQTHLNDNDLDLGTDTTRCNSEPTSQCQKLISYVRGTDTYSIKSVEYEDWKLGDIFHSNAVIVGEPSRFFEEECFDKCPDGSKSFYQNYKGRTKVVIVGANDGMLHTFNVTHKEAKGAEAWAFIPNSLLKNLKSMRTNHTYYVDSSPKVADVWFDYNGDHRKTANEWKTVLLCGLRKGGKHYFALDITDTLNPQYLWEFPNDGTTLAKVGQSWSEPAIGRVKIEDGSGGLVERWVAFMGGGFDPSETRSTPASVGKAFFVIDIRNGNIIKEFFGISGMSYSFAAPPTVVDTNSDGFVDKVYMGDLGGQMWVFDVSFNEITKKSDSLWTGRTLFTAPVSSSEKHSIYYQPALAFDRYGKPWVYFGTGDRENPNDYTNQNERFYAVKDDGKGTYPRTENNNTLLEVTSSNTFTQIQDPLKGWMIKLEKSANSLEKVLAKPAVFNQLVYFTTYTYTYSESTNPCYTGGIGSAKAYIVEYRSGGGAVSTLDDNLIPSATSNRWVPISGSGSGLPSPPVISVSLNGKASITILTTTGQILSQKVFSPSVSKAPIYWRELIR
jgi:Tfp pilus tip-associated adhesin PilY1